MHVNSFPRYRKTREVVVQHYFPLLTDEEISKNSSKKDNDIALEDNLNIVDYEDDDII